MSTKITFTVSTGLTVSKKFPSYGRLTLMLLSKSEEGVFEYHENQAALVLRMLAYFPEVDDWLTGIDLWHKTNMPKFESLFNELYAKKPLLVEVTI